MIPLSTEFEEKGFCYVQVKREGDYAIFTQEHKASGRIRYEVIHIRIRQAHTWPTGLTTPEREGYPSSASWGQFGRTCFTLMEAQAIFDVWYEREKRKQ